MALFGPGVPLGKELFFCHDIGGADLWHLYLPFWRFAADCGARGELPLWCPGLGTGLPLLAEGQVGALYPPNLVLRTLLPLPVAFNLAILFSLLLAGAGTAVFARLRGAGRGGSLLAGTVFGLGGFFLVHIRHPNLIAAAAWFPPILCLVESFLLRGRTRSLVLLALAVALAFLAGHPQMAAYDLLMAGVYAAVRLGFVWRRGAEGGGGAGAALRAGAWLLAAVLLGAVLAMPQIAPSYELKGLGSRRAGLDLEEASRSQIRPRLLVTFLWPGAFGDPGELREVPATDPATGGALRNPGTGAPLAELVGFDPGPCGRELYWEVVAYLGLVPLLLAVVALLSRGTRSGAVPLLVLLGLALLLSTGTWGGLYTLLHRFVPGFDLFRFPSRFLVYAAFALAVLAGLGLDHALGRLPRRRAPRAVATGVVLALCFLDLRNAFGDQNPTVDAAAWMTPPASARRIEALEAGNAAPFRITTIDPGRRVFSNAYARARGWKGDLTPYDPARTDLDPNLSLLFGLNSLLIHSPSQVDWTSRVSSLLFLPEDPRRPGAILVNTRIASVLNVRYYLDPFDVFAGLPPLAEYPGDVLLAGSILLPLGPPYTIRLRRNPDAFPRALLVPRSRVIVETPAPEGELDAAQRALISRGFDPRREVILAPDRVFPPRVREGPCEPIPAPVEFLSYSPRRVRLRADAPQGCWLFLSDTFYPGWKATLDGRSTPIYRANICGRAVWFPAGRHEVEFRYRPVSFTLGLVAAGIGLALLAALARLRRRRASPGGFGAGTEPPGAGANPRA